jgi:hypothetical protein
VTAALEARWRALAGGGKAARANLAWELAALHGGA